MASNVSLFAIVDTRVVKRRYYDVTSHHESNYVVFSNHDNNSRRVLVLYQFLPELLFRSKRANVDLPNNKAILWLQCIDRIHECLDYNCDNGDLSVDNKNTTPFYLLVLSLFF
jgi:hypothetical protein